jgi:hypothetical protein
MVLKFIFVKNPLTVICRYIELINERVDVNI